MSGRKSVAFMAPPALAPFAAQSMKKPSLRTVAKPRSQRADEADQLKIRQFYLDQGHKCMKEGNDKECPKPIRDGMLACVPKGFTAARWLTTDKGELTDEMKALNMDKKDRREAMVCIPKLLWNDRDIGIQLQALKKVKSASALKKPASVKKQTLSIKKPRTVTGYPKIAPAVGGGWW